MHRQADKVRRLHVWLIMARQALTYVHSRSRRPSGAAMRIVRLSRDASTLQAYHPARMTAITDLNATRAVFSWTRRPRYFAYLSALELTPPALACAFIFI